VAYEMACSHDGRFVSTTTGWYGSWNDKTIVQFDPLPLLLQENSAYSDVVFEVRTGPDSTESLTGPYAIVDGGYHNLRHLMSANRNVSDHDFAAWRKKLESVRKDIECAFGRLKGRWRILKLPMQFQKKEMVDNTVLTCVTLHNMLHDLDGRGEWESGVEWGGKDGEFDDAGRNWGIPTVHGSRVAPDADYSRIGRLAFATDVIVIHGQRQPRDFNDLQRMVRLQCETSMEWRILQKKLVTNYKYYLEVKGLIRWLRSSNEPGSVHSSV
jgi:hypothetical protein